MSDFYERINNLSQKRLVLLAMELQSRLEALEGAPAAPSAGEHDIAVIGMSCRFPGGANSPEAFWQLLQEGRDAVTVIPRDRWDADAYFDPDLEADGKMSTRWGGFMSGIDQFDPALFGITPREAATMDPQQRIILEVSWEALERAGYAPDRLAGTSTGVFVGACNGDYGHMLMNTELETVDMYMATGGAHSVISGRIAYVLGLQGPAISVDTACSSSLVAIHYAIKSLRTKECRMALAGGVNAIITPDVSITLSKAKMMATEGRCKAFAADADGFVRSEGCGVIVLKRLADAEADGDPIIAVIRGTAINQDGRSNGLTAPNGPSQVSVIRAALADAGMSPADVDYIETHGTGTTLGDPIEAQALGVVFSQGHTKDNPLMIGSAKTNLGHLESAAGVAGLMKMLLAIQHGEIPPHIHLKELSPHIAWDELPITIPTTRTPWAGRRVAGTSSFGFSGTNVHIIAEAYQPAPVALPDAVQQRDAHLVCLSTKTDKALQALAARYETFLSQQPEKAFAEIAYAANTSRASLSQRLALVASSAAEARQKLAAFQADPQGGAVIFSGKSAARPPEITFLFTGHGAQFAGMGRKLYETEPVFRQTIDRISQLAAAYLPTPLIDALYPPQGGDAALMDSMTYGQPAIFALQMALAELWRSWGIQPAVVAGHSLGEYAAAVVAGIFSLEDGLKLVCTRGRLMDNLPQEGSMASVFTTEEEISEVISPLSDGVSIAVINAPTNIVISGIPSAVDQALALFEARGVKTRRLAIAAGAHSPLVDPMRDEFMRAVSTVTFLPPRIDLVSCTTGEVTTAAEASEHEYWWRHLRQPVQFARVMETMQERGQAVFVEIGPHPVLLSIGQRVLPGGYGTWVPSLREKVDDTQQMLEALGMLYTSGAAVNWSGVYRGTARSRMLLPTYPFDHQRYWFTTASKQSPARGPAGHTASPLAGQRLHSPALEDAVYETQLSANWPPYLDHHRIFGTSIAPSPAFIEMAARAAQDLFGEGQYRISNLAILEAMILPEEGLRTAQVILTADGEDSAAFRIVSLEPGGQWKTHVTGIVARQETAAQDDPAANLGLIAEAQTRCTEEMEGDAYYQGVAGLGLEFGESFRGLQHIWRRDGEALGKVQIPESMAGDTRNYRFHPALLDACFHLVGAPLPGAKVDMAYLLIGLEHMRFYRPPAGTLWNHTVLTGQSDETFTGDIRLYDESGALVAEAQGLQLKRATRELLMRAVRPRFDDWLYQVIWQPKPLPLGQPAAKPAAWAIVPDAGGFAQQVAAQMALQGESCRVLNAGETAPEGAHVIYLPGLDAAATGDGQAALEQEVRLCAGALQTLQNGRNNRVWIVTRGAQPVDATPVQPAASALWGLGRVIALEQPEAWGGLVDLDPALSLAEQAATLADEARAGDIEDQVGYRAGQRSVARLAHAARPTAPTYSFSPDGAYLVTGGLGGIGLVMARWLADHGARHLVLTGRHGLPPRSEWDAPAEDSQQAHQVAAVREIEAATGASIDAAAVDVSDMAALRALIGTFGASRPALKGIFHAAAVLSNCSVPELDAGDLRAMFTPKIQGAWNLHEATRGLDLDFLVLFSSTTALWGSSQLAHYAAANTFLDSLAHYRRQQGLPALSVNWGTWEAMRVASKADQERVAQFGLEQMPTDAAMSTLSNVIQAGQAQITIAAVDWSTLKAAYEARRARPLLEGLHSKKAEAKPAARSLSLGDQLHGVPAEERRALIVEHVRQHVARVISAPDPAALNITQGLFEMGLDSLMSVELKGKLESSVGKPLPSTLTFNYPTIADLARYLDESVLAAPTPVESAPTAAPAAPAAEAPEGDIEDMSEDDLAALLASKLSKLK